MSQTDKLDASTKPKKSENEKKKSELQESQLSLDVQKKQAFTDEIIQLLLLSLNKSKKGLHYERLISLAGTAHPEITSYFSEYTKKDKIYFFEHLPSKFRVNCSGLVFAQKISSCKTVIATSSESVIENKVILFFLICLLHFKKLNFKDLANYMSESLPIIQYYFWLLPSSEIRIFFENQPEFVINKENFVSLSEEGLQLAHDLFDGKSKKLYLEEVLVLSLRFCLQIFGDAHYHALVDQLKSIIPSECGIENFISKSSNGDVRAFIVSHGNFFILDDSGTVSMQKNMPRAVVLSTNGVDATFDLDKVLKCIVLFLHINGSTHIDWLLAQLCDFVPEIKVFFCNYSESQKYDFFKSRENYFKMTDHFISLSIYFRKNGYVGDDETSRVGKTDSGPTSDKTSSTAPVHSNSIEEPPNNLADNGIGNEDNNVSQEDTTKSLIHFFCAELAKRKLRVCKELRQSAMQKNVAYQNILEKGSACDFFRSHPEYFVLHSNYYVSMRPGCPYINSSPHGRSVSNGTQGKSQDTELKDKSKTRKEKKLKKKKDEERFLNAVTEVQRHYCLLNFFKETLKTQGEMRCAALRTITMKYSDFFNDMLTKISIQEFCEVLSCIPEDFELSKKEKKVKLNAHAKIAVDDEDFTHSVASNQGTQADKSADINKAPGHVDSPQKLSEPSGGKHVNEHCVTVPNITPDSQGNLQDSRYQTGKSEQTWEKNTTEENLWAEASLEQISTKSESDVISETSVIHDAGYSMISSQTSDCNKEITLYDFFVRILKRKRCMSIESLIKIAMTYKESFKVILENSTIDEVRTFFECQPDRFYLGENGEDVTLIGHVNIQFNYPIPFIDTNSQEIEDTVSHSAPISRGFPNLTLNDLDPHLTNFFISVLKKKQREMKFNCLRDYAMRHNHFLRTVFQYTSCYDMCLFFKARNLQFTVKNNQYISIR